MTSQALQRARGLVRAEIGAGARRSRLLKLRQEGCLRLRFPRVATGPVEAVLVNTAGGLAGGDRLSQAFVVERQASLGIVTQACERVYRSLGESARVETAITVEEDASLAWLPQETILFDGGRLERRLEVDAAPTSRLLICESVLLGREAMGESVRTGRLAERWRIRVGGRLVFADDLRLDGNIAALSGSKATLAGGRAFATILAAGIEPDMAVLRSHLGASGGASRIGEVILVRLVAPSGLALRRRLLPLLEALAPGPLPRLWSL